MFIKINSINGGKFLHQIWLYHHLILWQEMRNKHYLHIHQNIFKSETDPRPEMTGRSTSGFPADEFICNFKVRAQQNNTICVSHLVYEYQWNGITCSPSTTVVLKNENVRKSPWNTAFQCKHKVKEWFKWSHYTVDKYLWWLTNRVRELIFPVKISKLVEWTDWDFTTQFSKETLTYMFWHPWQNGAFSVPVEYVLIKDNSLT